MLWLLGWVVEGEMIKKLNLGCGKNIKKGWINVDIQSAPGIDKSFDFSKMPYPFENNEFDEILINHVLEHIPNPLNVIKEIWRVSKNGAKIRIVVPYYTSYWSYADYTPVNFFNKESLIQLMNDAKYIHKKKREQFRVVEVKEIPQRFLGWVPKAILDVLKKFLNHIIVILELEAVAEKNT